MIFYFSGTGNTRWAARQLAEATGEPLISITEALHNGKTTYRLAEGERIGFCFPVHGWQPPQIVRRFIRQLSLQGKDNTHFCYALCTCGDDIGETITILNKELKKIGCHTDSAYSLIMPETYVCLPFMHTDTPEREKEKIALAKKEMRRIAEEVKERKKGVMSIVKGPTPLLYSYVLGAYFNRFMISDKPFLVDKERCSRCGKCAKVCPTCNISYDGEGWPVFAHQHQCTCCLACYHHCPHHAINYGKRTKNRGQYFFKE